MIEAFNTRMQEHQAKFRCHICHKPSDGPALVDTQGAKGDTLVTKDWNKPTGLAQCAKCRQWTCDQHLVKEAPSLLGRLTGRHSGARLCQTCAQAKR